eukprot:5721009-Pyramimonas_sp.AAC.1
MRWSRLLLRQIVTSMAMTQMAEPSTFGGGKTRSRIYELDKQILAGKADGEHLIKLRTALKSERGAPREAQPA